MAGARRSTMMININGGSGNRQRLSSSRLIPKRGQVKAGIAIGLAHSLSAIFSLNNNNNRRSSGSNLLAKPSRTIQ
ncbi:hypothetical protein AQUCO_00800057v1 [Aquilegia coerulea]|uniref:Uncharacterized protein n=1 Tax=Aquilegia coerulea TaxID=218851 RepID=A0A2G5EH66_AQUCA|nr:hypothetical protein AQUCO_00800057v1 [Aquilegia coerulea]